MAAFVMYAVLTALMLIWALGLRKSISTTPTCEPDVVRLEGADQAWRDTVATLDSPPPATWWSSPYPEDGERARHRQDWSGWDSQVHD